MQSNDIEPTSGPSDPWPVDVERSAAPNSRQGVFTVWTLDVLVYVVVLNLYVEYSEAKAIDSFTISILTAVLLKILLAVITTGKSIVWRWAKSKGAAIYTVVGVLGVWAGAFFSEFAILEDVELVFGGKVQVGSVAEVVLLVIGLLVVREVVVRVYLWLGRSTDV